jgi:cupin 2 domain-containing protein
MPELRRGSLLAPLPPGQAGDREQVDRLLGDSRVRIERIVSTGQASPPDFWYDQADDEFVVLLAGSARLRFENGEVVDLAPGDWVDIPAHVRHRVESTEADPPTVWLAVFRPAAEVPVPLVGGDTA